MRGTAEIETLFVIPLLLSFIFLAGGLVVLGHARLSNAFNAESNAYAQNVIGQNTITAQDLTPIDGPAAVRPGLPNRFDEAYLSQDVTVPFGKASNVVPIADRAAFLDPAWHYSAFSHGDDQVAAENWFEDYVAEDHSPTVDAALGLQPAWPP